MGKPNITLFIATSLDGFIARKDGRIDWLYSDNDYGFSKFFEDIDAIVMGRKTFDQVSSFGEWPYQGKKCYVFTYRKLSVQPKGVEQVEGEVTRVIRTIYEQGASRIWLVGGADLVNAFRSEHLIDSYTLTIHPVLLGEGIRLFGEVQVQENLELVEFRKYPSGLVQLSYNRQP